MLSRGERRTPKAFGAGEGNFGHYRGFEFRAWLIRACLGFRNSDFEFQSFGPSRSPKRSVAECPPDRLAPSLRAAVSGAGKRYCRSKRLAEPQTRMAIQSVPEAITTTASTIAIFHCTGIGLREGSTSFRNGFPAFAVALPAGEGLTVCADSAGENVINIDNAPMAQSCLKWLLITFITFGQLSLRLRPSLLTVDRARSAVRSRAAGES